MHPLADSFIPLSRASSPEKSYPLEVQLCKECGNAQLKCETSPVERYQELEYSYQSSHSPSSRGYWEKFALDMDLLVQGKAKLNVLEIGSNDGYLLSILNGRGHNVLGVDASPAACKSAEVRNVKAICAIFSDTIAQELLDSGNNNFDLIIANNVLNHSDDPVDFVRGVERLLADGGRFVFESPYWLTSLNSRRFDQIYHEHVTYLTARSVTTLLSRCGLSVSGISASEYHGGSLRVVAERVGSHGTCSELSAYVDTEIKTGIFDHSYFTNYFSKLILLRNSFLVKLLQIKISEPNTPVICIGAAAKGNTFLNFFRLDHSLIDFVTDVSPTKIGKLTPFTRIPIESDLDLARLVNPYVILTSWNMAAALRDLIVPINPTVRFLDPYED